MAAPKLCVVCGLEPKRRGHARWCQEDWACRQGVEVRARLAARRAAAVPEALRRTRVIPAHWPPGRRWCAGCQSFVRMKDCSGSRCTTCASVAHHGSALASEYVIHGRPFTRADYEALYAAQGGRCALCHRSSGSRRLAVDHDHRTGQVRGLLCPDPEWGCNLKVVARFDADPDPLAMAARLVEYLQAPIAQRILS